jgi:hypothetical protein
MTNYPRAIQFCEGSKTNPSKHIIRGGSKQMTTLARLAKISIIGLLIAMVTLVWPAHQTTLSFIFKDSKITSLVAASPAVDVEIIDFHFEKDGKGETTYAMNDECTCAISVKNTGLVGISHLNLELTSDIKQIKLVGGPAIPSWIIRKFAPHGGKIERLWEVKIKPGETKEYRETHPRIEWVREETASTVGEGNFSVDENAIVTVKEYKLGPLTVHNSKTDIKGPVEYTLNISIEGKSYASKLMQIENAGSKG